MGPERLVAIVDDDESIRETTQDLLESAGYRATVFGSAAAFLAVEAAQPFDCLITDIRMPEMTGLDLVHVLAARGRGIPVIMVTAYPEEATRTEAARAGILCYLQKPFTSESLLECVERACARGATTPAGLAPQPR